METPYDAGFFVSIEDTATLSAQIVVPIILGLVRPSSVVDIGGGKGDWSAVFAEFGIVDSVCVDGAYVDRTTLKIAPERFIEADVSKPLYVDRRFDLAVCLEVAEHLVPEAAEVLIDSLTRHADAVLFSAAIPFQGGTNHINLQWPTYWAAKFATRGYRCFDAIRRLIWNNDAVAAWYKQNSFLYLNSKAIERLGPSSTLLDTEAPEPHALVHPDIYMFTVTRRPRLTDTVRTLVEIAKASVTHRVRKVLDKPRAHSLKSAMPD